MPEAIPETHGALAPPLGGRRWLGTDAGNMPSVRVALNEKRGGIAATALLRHYLERGPASPLWRDHLGVALAA